MSLPIFVAERSVAHWTHFRPWCTNEWYVAMNLGEEFDVVVSDMSGDIGHRVFHNTISVTVRRPGARHRTLPPRTIIQNAEHLIVPRPVTGAFRMPADDINTEGSCQSYYRRTCWLEPSHAYRARYDTVACAHAGVHARQRHNFLRRLSFPRACAESATSFAVHV